jgi:hypothetical protein
MFKLQKICFGGEYGILELLSSGGLFERDALTLALRRFNGEGILLGITPSWIRNPPEL